MSDPTPERDVVDLDTLTNEQAIGLLNSVHAEPERQAPDPDDVDQTPAVDDLHTEA